MKKIIVNKNDSDQRLDKFMQKYFKRTMPITLIYKYIRKKRIKVNGKNEKFDYILKQGDILELYINDEFFKRAVFLPKAISSAHKLNILYEDENILLVNKKAGMLSHSDTKSSSVNSLVLSYLYQTGEYKPDKENSFTPSICNRLDRNTGGIVIAAKNANALRDMNYIIKNRMVKRIYLALCHGKFKIKSAILTDYLVKNKIKKKAEITNAPKGGAPKIITSYNVLFQTEDKALLEIELITGRFHQIRAHLAAIGHPIIGDVKYGSSVNNTGQALYAQKLIFLDGFEDTSLSYLQGKTFTAQAPDFLRLLDY